jgi:hypothetical protein
MKYIFSGAGMTYIAGIPARDLTEQEFKKLSASLQEMAIKSKLYKPLEEKEPEKEPAKKESRHADK